MIDVMRHILFVIWQMGARKMKDLTVKFWAQRGYYVINASRVGLSHSYGNFKSYDAAIAEAELLKAKFLTGAIVQPVAVTKCLDASDNFLASQMRRVEDDEISLAHFKDLKRGMDFVLAIIIDGKTFSKHALDKLVTKANKDELSAAFKRAIKSEGRSKSTAEKRIKVLKAFFNFCQGKGWINLNPLDKVSFGLSTEIADRAPKIQPETVQKLVTEGLVGESVTSRAMVLTALSSGIRQGELRALPWSCIDFKEGTLRVKQAVKTETSKIGDPKTKRGFRTIPVPSETMQLLRELKMQSRHTDQDDLVFATAAGLPKQKKTLRELVERASQRAGISRMVWGDMRHFFASVQLSALGEDWAEVAALMGHSNPSFTYSQYGHYSKNEAKQEKARSAAAKAIYG
jgi:integrase